MIHALDHILLATRDLEAAATAYELLLGRRADWVTAGGRRRRIGFQLANTRLELTSASEDEPLGLVMLGFATADLGKAQRLLERRGLPVTRRDGARVADVAPAATHGPGICLLESSPDLAEPGASPPAAGVEQDAVVAGLDHVVIRSPNPERAVTFYAGRLGLSLRLDRTEPTWDARLLFFRCGDLIVEVAHDLAAGQGDGPDRLWGLSWRVGDLAKAHRRLRASGIEVSDVRGGRRPHTKVFTAKSHTAGVPTLVIGAAHAQNILPSHV